MAAPTKPRIGRPPIPEAERHSRKLLVGMTEAEHEALRAWAGDRPLGRALVETALRSAKRAG